MCILTCFCIGIKHPLLLEEIEPDNEKKEQTL